MKTSPAWFKPQGLSIAGVSALSTTRLAGVSKPPFDSFNLGAHVGDDPADVKQNRQQLPTPTPPIWLNQVHGNDVVFAEEVTQLTDPVSADAIIATSSDLVCAVMTADCLPVLLADNAARVVAAVHCGWRSLAAGILTKTLAKIENETDIKADAITAWLGPAIGAAKFEVGAEVKQIFTQLDAENLRAFKSVGHSKGDKYLADLYFLASSELTQLGVNNIHQQALCTYTDASRFFSYRRDGQTGRMASLIWLD